MNNKRCMVLWDYPCCAGITIKKGTICEVLKDDQIILWINPYIEEIGEEIPFPILKSYIRYL